MRVGNRGGIARLGAAYFDEDGAHDAKLMMRFSIRLSFLLADQIWQGDRLQGFSGHVYAIDY
jgi:hypothetical protein